VAQAEIGLIGLAVMGRNLALNIADKGHSIAVWNRTASRTADTLKEAARDGLAERMTGTETLRELVAAVARPRSIIIMVKAGAPVDEAIDDLVPLLDQGDCIIDCGNAFWRDTVRREAKLKALGLDFLGIGVSGGEEGARHGPSIMAGGASAAYGRIAPILSDISAKFKGESCAAHVGPDGAGHFVKTIHNGIEYADMAMIGEAYGVLRHGLGLTPVEIGQVFARWNQGPLSSYLVEITADILRRTDPKTGKPMVDVIVDAAGQKGTGKWSAIDAFDLAVPAGAIGAAVEGRVLSSLAALRAGVSGRYGTDVGAVALGDRDQAIAAVEKALLAGKIGAYAQGFSILEAASAAHNWNLPLGTVARIWRAGCIIRSTFLDTIAAAYDADAQLASLLLDKELSGLFAGAVPSLRQVLAAAMNAGQPVPVLATTLGWFDSLRTARSTAELLQAQRDFFGAHGFGRVDEPGEHHGPWGLNAAQ
jgi:6-phosphogluconate dehydrogenase